MKIIRIFLACIVSILFLDSCTSSVKVSPRSSKVSIGPNFYGVNFDLAGFVPFAKDNPDTILVVLEPSTIRWPGGTEANFYDWHTGLDTRKPAKVAFTLKDLEKACQTTGAVPIFDLNVLSSDNATNPSDQIAMLKAAQQLGLPIDYVEIGNELYSNAPGVPQKFPNGYSYAKTVSIYVRALHKAFPGVKVAADAIPFPEDKREMSWDTQLLAKATGDGAPDAYVVHFYPGLYQKPFNSSDLPALFENIYNSITELSNAVQKLGGKPVWLTEYNMRGPYQIFRKKGVSPAEYDYAHELYLAAFAAMLPRVHGLALVDSWTALADGFYGAWQNPSAPYLTDAGEAIEMVDSVAKGATMAQPIKVAQAVKLPDGDPGVVGERFIQPDQSSSSILINLTSKRVSVATKGWISPGSYYEQVSGDPTVAEPVAPFPTMGFPGNSGFSLPPYSITAVQPSKIIADLHSS